MKNTVRKVKLEARLRRLISAHCNVVSSCEIDSVLEDKYQTLNIASCKMMLETTIGQSSEQDEEEQDEKPLNLSTQVPPLMISTEIEFRRRLDSMENDNEVHTHLDPKTIDERELYYLLTKK